MQLLQSKEQFDVMLERGNDFVLYKHSPTCPISASAKQELEHALVHNIGMEDMFYMVDVIVQRPLSQYIAQVSQIKHESPQILLFQRHDDGVRVVSYASHHSINAAYVQDVIDQLL